MKEWAANRDTIIASYPQHFAAEGDEQVTWITDYLSKHDWFAKGIYLDQAREVLLSKDEWNAIRARRDADEAMESGIEP